MRSIAASIGPANWSNVGDARLYCGADYCEK
jgi:hypothetical protein